MSSTTLPLGSRPALAIAALAFAVNASAGLRLEQAIDRDRVLRDNAERRDNRFALLSPLPEGALVALGGPSERIPWLVMPELPERGGIRAISPWWSPSTPQDGPRARLGLAAYDGVSTAEALEGSAFEWPVGGGAAFYASVETRHWGPGWMGSLILDAAASSLPAVGWRKTSATSFETRWLSWMGPWNADVFVGRLSGHVEPANPYLIGMRLQIRPWSNVEIGLSRGLQWGGEGRDESLRSLFDALIGSDNTEGNDRSGEPGNQLAGVDVRYSVPLDTGELAFYAHYIGEDAAGIFPSKKIWQLGTEWATRWRGTHLRYFVEGVNMVAGDIFSTPEPGVAYRHEIYQQGYTHRGLPLGHPIGGDVKFASLGLLFDGGRYSGLVGVHGGRSQEEAQRFEPDVSLAGLNAAAQVDLGPRSRAGISAWLWRAGSQRSNALQAWWQTAWR